MTKKHAGGRPLKFQNPEILQKLGDEFFARCDENKEPYTITGLALALGTTRECLVEYERRKEYANIVKGLKQRCQNYAEKRLFGNNPAGAIFALKNYGWSDRTDIQFPDAHGNPQLIGGDIDRAARLVFLLELAEKRAKNGERFFNGKPESRYKRKLREAQKKKEGGKADDLETVD